MPFQVGIIQGYTIGLPFFSLSGVILGISHIQHFYNHLYTGDAQDLFFTSTLLAKLQICVHISITIQISKKTVGPKLNF